MTDREARDIDDVFWLSRRAALDILWGLLSLYVIGALVGVIAAVTGHWWMPVVVLGAAALIILVRHRWLFWGSEQADMDLKGLGTATLEEECRHRGVAGHE